MSERDLPSPESGGASGEALPGGGWFMRAVLDNLFAFVGVLDLDGTMVEVNRAPLEAAGIAISDVLGKKFWDCYWWAHSEEVRERLRDACERAARGELIRYDEVVRMAGDTRMVIDFQLAPLRDDGGRVTHLIPSAINITERRRALEALREGEARFRALADNMSQLAWMADRDGAIFWYNQRWVEYTGTTLEDMQVSGWPSVHHPDHIQRVTEGARRSFETGEQWEDVFPLLGRDGRYRWFLSRARPFRDDDGRIVSWIGTHTDITAQRDAEEVLRQAVKLRDEFLSVASHELRTPLTALGLQLETLRRLLEKRTEGQDPRVLAKVEAAFRQSQRLGTLIDGLLNVSRIIAGRIQLDLDVLDLADVVCDTVERLTDLAARAGCELRVLPGGGFHGRWDRSRLDQVVMNLLTNAIKYGAGHPIDIALAAVPEGVELRVQDHGIGIPEPDQARIFDRFERAVPSTHYGGFGLGLYIVREIVEAHGGTIHVRSAPGNGSTFIVRLPPGPPAGDDSVPAAATR